ncbi:hypothetical protein [Acetivibrio clariflavus]|nr:hypothetical protein [Acetivibrio clariflavus]
MLIRPHYDKRVASIQNPCGEPIIDYNFKPDRSLFYEERKNAV